jgi:hypothetical protein
VDEWDGQLGYQTRNKKEYFHALNQSKEKIYAKENGKIWKLI